MSIFITITLVIINCIIWNWLYQYHIKNIAIQHNIVTDFMRLIYKWFPGIYATILGIIIVGISVPILYTMLVPVTWLNMFDLILVATLDLSLIVLIITMTETQ